MPMDNAVAVIDSQTRAAGPCMTPVARLSIYADCEAEAAKFKWIESEKAGFDLGESAIRNWVRDHWTGYLRAKWLEHLQGKCFWIELDRGDFGLLQHQFQDQRDLLDPILDKLKSGQENLDIICWAKTSHISLAVVMQILEALDINSRRLIHQFERIRG
jgi:hypothetical protein